MHWRHKDEKLTHRHSPHETVKGETTLSPTLRVEYSTGRLVTAAVSPLTERKFEPRAMTSPTNSCPEVWLSKRVIVISLLDQA